MTPNEDIAALKAENAVLRKQVSVLVARVQELKARLAKDSHNSSKPPSSDEEARVARGLTREQRRPGVQECDEVGGEEQHENHLLAEVVLSVLLPAPFLKFDTGQLRRA